MPLVYIETSALVKRYMSEKGSDVVDLLFDDLKSDEFLAISVLATVELKSALARLVRGKGLYQSELERLIAEFNRDARKIPIVLPIEQFLLEDVIGLLDNYPLRTGDAIHLASILRLRDMARRGGLPTIVVVSDNELVAACQTEGISTINPDEDAALEQLRQIRSS